MERRSFVLALEHYRGRLHVDSVVQKAAAAAATESESMFVNKVVNLESRYLNSSIEPASFATGSPV